ncbi:muscarinic acetylcholine receptor M1 [Electrophorus electricus]|uniref:muscarinic acetylcholine receptor M1 n=1 Tax=Electrophorus electricus TaxID=8005 RepID=UPI0015D032A4|nr:muscarinic acetylcholine receptor M1 [Electrophorus electricus]XP_026888011.2 muscarinic acetylcholine receptor M1 [Electrophorus electricus]XP_026888012.2 muscarinic acetylcholine receptor M1 [Electrophorus electricus]
MNHTCESQLSNATADPLGGHKIWEVALIVLVTGPLSFITILGNLLVLISFRVNSQLRTISNYYLLSLAVADLILGMVSMNLYTAYIIMGRWMLGHLACDLWLALDYVASNASVMNLLVISFDRYFSVTRPLTYRARRTPKRAAVLIALAWVVSFVLWAPAILFWPHEARRPSTEEEEVKNCSIPFLAEPSLTFGTAIAAFYLPVSIMIVLYWRIYWEIENRAKGLAKFMGSVSSSEGNSVKVDKPSIYQNNDHSSFSSSMERMPRKGQSLARSESVGCFPGRPKSLVTGNVNTHSPTEELNYKEAYSSSSWNIDDEDDDGTTSSFTEEEQEQDLQGTVVSASNLAVIRLKYLQGSSEDRRELPAPPAEATDLTAGEASTHSSPKVPGLPDVSLHKQPKAKWRINTIIREKKAARMLSAILLAFILTWTPYNIMVLASVSYCVPEKLWQLGYWLCYVNSTVNPMCYALSNESFRTTFKALLTFRRGVARRWEAGRQSQHTSVRQDKSCSTV